MSAKLYSSFFFFLISLSIQVSGNALYPSLGNRVIYSEKEKIELLIKSIQDLKDAKFDRNGSLHSAQEAAQHLRGKYKKSAKHITTAKDFIEKIASKSGISGKPYHIVYSNGSKITSGEFLLKKLGEIEKTSAKK